MAEESRNSMNTEDKDRSQVGQTRARLSGNNMDTDIAPVHPAKPVNIEQQDPLIEDTTRQHDHNSQAEILTNGDANHVNKNEGNTETDSGQTVSVGTETRVSEASEASEASEDVITPSDVTVTEAISDGDPRITELQEELVQDSADSEDRPSDSNITNDASATQTETTTDDAADESSDAVRDASPADNAEVPVSRATAEADPALGALDGMDSVPLENPPAYSVSEAAYLPHTHQTGSPPPYIETLAEGEIPLTFVDFVPIHMNGEYQSFGALMTQANTWLSGHAGYRTKFCECVERAVDVIESDISISLNYERTHLYKKFIRTLRLWLTYNRDWASQASQRIRYLTVVPTVSEQESTGGGSTLLPLDRTLLRFNAKLRSHPIQGKVMNVETQESSLVKGKGPCDPESTYHEERERVCQYYTSLRIYYEEGPPCYEEIGYTDFVPKLLSKSTDFLTFDKYEKYGTVVKRANEWISSQSNKTLLNIQSIDYRGNAPITARKPDLIDTNVSWRISSNDKMIVGLRFLRLYYAKVFSGALTPPSVVPNITHKHFLPIKIAEAGMMGSEEFETQQQYMERFIDWMRNAGVSHSRVLGVESVSVRVYGGNQDGDPEVTLTGKSGGGYKYFLLGTRVYLDGEVPEPSASDLLPIPIVMPAKQCCVLQ